VGNDRRARARLSSAIRQPLRLCLVCPVCFWQVGPERSRIPVVVAAVRRRQSMPLCEKHLSTATSVGLSVRRLAPADDVLDALLDIYGVEELSFVDTSIASSRRPEPFEPPRAPGCCSRHEAESATRVTREPSIPMSVRLQRRDRRIGRTRSGIHVDEKLTERRDEASLDGIEGTHETCAELRFSSHKPVTSGFGRGSALLDAEEVRGSNPLAPNSKGPGHSAFFLSRPIALRAQVAQRLTKS
jgi:hypothetical protein